MKASFVPLVFFFVLTLPCAAPLYTDTCGNVEITDSTGTTTGLSDLRYCFEETEGDEVYINKFEEFFVRRGAAVIRVKFSDLKCVVFKGPSSTSNDPESRGRVQRKACFIMKSGKEVDASLLCHDGCFLQGNHDLGELTVAIDDVKKIDFATQGQKAIPSLKIKFFTKDQKPPPQVVTLCCDADGALRFLDGDETITKAMLEKALARMKGCVVLETREEILSSALKKALKTLQDTGAVCVWMKVKE